MRLYAELTYIAWRSRPASMRSLLNARPCERAWCDFVTHANLSYRDVFAYLTKLCSRKQKYMLSEAHRKSILLQVWCHFKRLKKECPCSNLQQCCKAMKLHVYLSILLITLFSHAWVDCANVPSCANMSSWFPGTPPSNHSENLPYRLSVHGHTESSYSPGTSHTVYLNGSKSFVGFIVYSESSVKNYSSGRFVQEDLPRGVEEVSCGDLYIIQNSTSSGSWTSVKMLWKAPLNYKAGNIAFRASVLESTNPLIYYEGLTVHLKYECPLVKCAECLGGGYRYDSYGCNTCQCICHVACAEIYAPVCGTDGKTHSNECEMNRQACEKRSPIRKKHSGKCKQCDMVCTEEYRPVCGTDEKTYGNKCTMEVATCENNKTVTVSYNGECSGAKETVKLSILSLMFSFLAFLMF